MPLPEPTSALQDDDGVIDLMALSSRPPPPRPAVDPLFAGPVSEPPAGFVRDVASSSSGISSHPALAKVSPYKTIIMIAAAAVVFLIVGTIGVSAVFSDSSEAKRASAWTHIPSPKVASAPPPVASEPEENASTPDKPSKKGGKWRARANASGGGKSVITSKTPEAAPKPPPKAADTCGCHGDFNCILRCSAKGK